jgi:structural maintenance of chromosome 1
MDAISFVLGIKSSHLRSSQLKDLVYRGRVLKHSTIDADGNATEVVNGATTNGNHTNGDAAAGSDDEGASHEASQRHDPSTAWVMAVFEDDAGTEQKWKRSISASGQSEYRINNRVVTAKQYNDALEAENILIKARNFLVFQGDVEAIASQSPKDLTRLIEQISGSLEYKDEYEKLKIESEKAAEDHAFRLNQRRAMNSEIKQYQEQKREADNFERKTAQRDDAIVTHILWKLYHLQQQIEASGQVIQTHQQLVQEHKRNKEAADQALEDARREHAKISRECSKIERNVKQKEREAEEKASDLVPIEKKLEISAESLAKWQAREASLQKERNAQSGEVDRLKKSIDTVEKAQKRWEEEWNKNAQKTGKQLTDADLHEYNTLRGEVTKQTTIAQTKVDNITRQLRTDDETASSLKSRIEMYDAQQQKIEAELKDMTSKKNDLASEAKQTQQDIANKKKELNSLTSERLRNAQKNTEINQKLQDVILKLRDADNGRRDSDRETRAKETVAAMKRIFPGVRGRLHELCKPKQQKYETAIGYVLGANWDAVIVDTESTARDCIAFLKEQRAGLATFIPLDTIQVKQVNPNLKSIHKSARLAIDAINFDTAVERAMSYACGNALIAEDDKTAKYLAYEKNIQSTVVTLDGTKRAKDGQMTGGTGKHEKKRRWDDAEVENLKKLKDKFIGELAQLEASTNQRRGQDEDILQGDLAGLTQCLEFLKQEAKSTERNLQDKKKELDFVKLQLKDIKPKYDQQARNVQTLQNSLQSHQSSIHKVEDKVFKVFCDRHGFSDVRQYEAQQGSLHQEASHKKLEFSQQKSRLNNQLAFENQRLESTSDRIQRIEVQIQETTRVIADLNAEKRGIENEIQKINKQAAALNKEIESKQVEAETRGTTVQAQRREMQKHAKFLDDTLKDIADEESSRQGSKAERNSLLRKCRMEEIKVPLKEGSAPLSALPLNDIQQTDPDAMDVDEEDEEPLGQIDDYGISVDFENLDEKLQSDASEKAEEKLKEQIENLTSELEKMAPNMRATDRLEGVESRLKTTEKELERARRDAKRAKDDFEQTKDTRLELFNKAFNHISDQIGIVYKDLTKSDQTHITGEA